MAIATAAPIIAAELRINDVTDSAVEADLAAFSGWLDRIDGWIEGGVLGGEPPNAADFQIAAALGLAMTLDDLRPAIESRPAGQLAARLVPGFPGKVPPVLPAAWLDPLTGSA
jgi:glutathione S-transferase